MKTKKEAVITSFLLGGFGLGQFYLGKISNGIILFLIGIFSLMLSESTSISFWVVPIYVNVITGFIYLFMDTKKFDSLYNKEILLKQKQEKERLEKIEQDKLIQEELERKNLEEENRRIEQDKLIQEELERKNLEEENRRIEYLKNCEEVYQNHISLYGEDIANKIKNCEIWLDMTTEQLVLIKRKPSNIEKHISKSIERLTYIYGTKNNGDTFIFENGLLVEYKDK